MSRDILLAFVNSAALGNIEMVFETSLTVSGSMSTGEAVFEVEFFETRQGDDVINADFQSKFTFSDSIRGECSCLALIHLFLLISMYSTPALTNKKALQFSYSIQRLKFYLICSHDCRVTEQRAYAAGISTSCFHAYVVVSSGSRRVSTPFVPVLDVARRKTCIR